VIRDWRPIDPNWVAAHAEVLRQGLGYPPLDPALTHE
jgi:hypothetical protein